MGIPEPKPPTEHRLFTGTNTTVLTVAFIAFIVLYIRWTPRTTEVSSGNHLSTNDLVSAKEQELSELTEKVTYKQAEYDKLVNDIATRRRAESRAADRPDESTPTEEKLAWYQARRSKVREQILKAKDEYDFLNLMIQTLDRSKSKEDATINEALPPETSQEKADPPPEIPRVKIALPPR